MFFKYCLCPFTYSSYFTLDFFCSCLKSLLRSFSFLKIITNFPDNPSPKIFFISPSEDGIKKKTDEFFSLLVKKLFFLFTQPAISRIPITFITLIFFLKKPLSHSYN